MTSGDSELDRIFSTALTCPTPEALGDFLDHACEGTPETRSRVEALIRAHENSGDFLDEPAVSPERAPNQEAPAELPGSRVGPYRIVERLGEGGYGVVYLAQQEEPVRREVALKVIKLGMDTRRVIARFQAERQTLALTDHPNIARVLDAGATDAGRPYFVMELVRGLPLCEYCDRHRLPLRERLELFVDVCRGVQHAHQKGIIHRDLKPSNVLVTVQDGRPVPKVIDFGVAKATRPDAGANSGPNSDMNSGAGASPGASAGASADSLHAAQGQLIGTPVYMCPEQAQMGGLDVDTRADIYSLGAMLYELLTGWTPFDSARLAQVGLDEVQRILAEEQPPPPSLRVQRSGEQERAQRAAFRRLEAGSFPSRLRGDLDWIVGKCLEKDRTRRYETADALAADVRRHLANEPVLAGAPSALYSLRKFVRRHRVLVTAVSLGSLALALGATLAAYGLVQAQRQAETATGRSRFLSELMSGAAPRELEARARSLFGDDHEAVAAVLWLGAGQARESGDLDEAQRLFEATLELRLALHGERHLAVALTHGRLGSLFRTRGEFGPAEEHLRRAIDIGESLPGGAGPALCETRDELAGLLQRKGDFDGAAAQLRASLDARRTSFPDQHDILGHTLGELADVLEDAGRLEQAVATRELSVEEFKRAFPESLSTADKLLAFGTSLKLFGRHFEAERQLREGLALYRANPALQWETYLIGLVTLEQILRHRSDPLLRVEAERLQEEAMALARRIYGPRSLELAKHIDRRAQSLSDQGLDMRAAALQEESFRIHEEVLGEAFRAAAMARTLQQLAGRIALRQNATREAYLVAEQVTARLLERFPEDVALRELRGLIDVRLERYETARAELTDPTSPTHLALQAIVFHHLGSPFAFTFLQRAREHARQERFRGDPVVESLLSEAAALIEGRRR